MRRIRCGSRVDAEPDAFDVGPCPLDGLNSLQDFLVFVERDAEIGVQPPVDVGAVEGKISNVKPVVDADVVVDRGDEVTGEDSQSVVALVRDPTIATRLGTAESR